MLRIEGIRGVTPNKGRLCLTNAILARTTPPEAARPAQNKEFRFMLKRIKKGKAIKREDVFYRASAECVSG